MNIWLVILVSILYLVLLFRIAYRVEHKPESKFHRASQGWMYALSLAVYCTSWTLYGNVGRAAHTGIVFTATYIGPILVFLFAGSVLRKILRIGKAQRTTSIADFISSRYGKSQSVAVVVTIIAMIGIMPYIALQLKGISTTFNLLIDIPGTSSATGNIAFYSDSAFYIALLLAAFVGIFGTRRVDASEQHHGMVAAIAFESVTKLLALLIVGAFISYGLFGGLGDLFGRAAADPRWQNLLDFRGQMSKISFWAEIALSAFAIICLPRQFQVTFVENFDESHLKKARWVLPLYLVAINLFVLPIALAGNLTFSPGSINPDNFVLALPLNAQSHSMALLAFIAGLSASTGMIIVEAIALSTMISNDLVMPILMRIGVVNPASGKNITGLVKGIRRAAILSLILLGYLYAKIIGDSIALVSIGLLSFVAAAQFAPAILLGIYWKGGNRKGALAGLGCGFALWLYTLFLPSIALSGWLPTDMLDPARIGHDWYHPYALFGMVSDKITHGLFWSLLGNVLAYVVVSLTTRHSILERSQAIAFVDIFDKPAPMERSWSEDIRLGDLLTTLTRFVGEPAPHRLAAHEAACRRQLDLARKIRLDDVEFFENEIAGVIGAASARIVIASVLKENQAVFLSNASQVIEIQWQNLRNAVENVNQGISMFDADLRLVIWNRQFFEMLDFPDRLAVVGTAFEDLIRYNAERGEYGQGTPDEYVEEIVSRTRKLIPHTFERTLPDGRVLEIVGKPLPGGGFVSTYTDISERKRQEHALREANDALERRVVERTAEVVMQKDQLNQAYSELELILNNASLGISVVGPRAGGGSEIRHINGALEGILNYQPGELLGQRADILYASREEFEKVRTGYGAALKQKQSYRGEHVLLSKTKQTMVIALVGAAIDLNDKTKGSIWLAEDISRRKQAEQALNDANVELNKTLKILRATQNELVDQARLASLGGMVAGVAHQLNTPLGNCLMIASAVQKQTLRLQETLDSTVKLSDIKSYVSDVGGSADFVMRNLQRAAELVTIFKQVAVDQSSFKRCKFMLDEVFSEINMALRPVLADHPCKILSNIAQGINMDSFPTPLGQVIIDLIANAAIHAFTDAKNGTITIGARQIEADFVELTVSDDGVGIAAENLPRIFDPFYTTKIGQGRIGLGLNIAHSMITGIMGGKISVDSETGRGTRFVLRVPSVAPDMRILKSHANPRQYGGAPGNIDHGKHFYVVD